MRRRHLLPAFLLTGMLIAQSTSAGPAWPGTSGATAVPPATLQEHDLTLPDIQGNPVSLGQFIGKKPVLLVFWATWCHHCNEAVPAINRLQSESGGGDRFQILALDYKESPEKVEAFIRKKQVGYPVLLDRKGTVASGYRILGIPTYILLDAAGRVVQRAHELPELSRILEQAATR